MPNHLANEKAKDQPDTPISVTGGSLIFNTTKTRGLRGNFNAVVLEKNVSDRS